MAAKKLSPVERLMMALDRCAIARGEANWTNGYRTAARKFSAPEDQRLWDKEQAQWRTVARVEGSFRRLAQRLLRDARRHSGEDDRG